VTDAIALLPAFITHKVDHFSPSVPGMLDVYRLNAAVRAAISKSHTIAHV